MRFSPWPILRVFLDAGASIEPIGGQAGAPGYAVALNGCTLLVHVTTPAASLTKEQIRWNDAWRAPAPVVRSVEDAEAVVAAIKAGEFHRVRPAA